MTRERLTMIGLLVLQIIAVALYPPVFFQQAPQAIVVPATLLLLAVLALVGMNTGALTPIAGRVSLVFVQGLNLVVRLMMFFPNLRLPTGEWNWWFLISMVIGFSISWWVIVKMEQLPVRSLLLWRSVD